MNKKTRNVIKALAVASTVATAAIVAVSKSLATVAIKRKIPDVPDNVTKILVGKSNPTFDKERIAENKEKMLLISHTDVKIRSYDGLKLSGIVYKTENAKRTIIAFHGWRSNCFIDFGESFDFLRESGCNLIYPDQRGQNGSDGEYVGFGIYERFDVLEWINYALNEFDTPVYIMGLSMGATTVLMASGFQLNERVKGIIADCGFTSPHAIWSHVLKNNMKVDDRIIYPLANHNARSKAKYDGDDYSTLDAMETNDKPILFIHGTSDTFVPVEMTYENYKKCKAPKELLIVPGATHGYSYLIETEKYQKTVSAFFEKYDK